MLSIRKQKGFKMVLNRVSNNELESFTLIHLNGIEEELFLREVGIDPKSFTKTKTLTYTTGDPLDELFKRFAQEHQQENNLFQNNLKKVKNEIKGKWCLIRKPDEHLISLIARENEEYSELNKLCISDERASVFCADCTRLNKKEFTLDYSSDLNEEKNMYTYWSDYMNAKYRRSKEGKWNNY